VSRRFFTPREEVFPVVQADQSDSASLDNAFEFLVLGGRSIYSRGNDPDRQYVALRRNFWKCLYSRTSRRAVCRAQQWRIRRRRGPGRPWLRIYDGGTCRRVRTSHAHEEGGERDWSVSTTAFVGENDQVRGIRAQRVSFEGGAPVLVPGTEFELKADLVLLATGFTGPIRTGLIDSLGLKLDPRGNVVTDSRYMTSHAKVFAAGDVRRGASLIVWAIAEGRKMAASVETYLRSQRQI
jgi:hypothetical protein